MPLPFSFQTLLPSNSLTGFGLLREMFSGRHAIQPSQLKFRTGKSSLKLGTLVGALVLLGAGTLLITSCVRTKHKGGGVHGSLFLGQSDFKAVALSGQKIYVPDLKVTLNNVNANFPGVVVSTNLNGEYFFPHQPAGTYKVCWDKPGFIAGCSPTFQIVSSTAFGGDLPVRAAFSSIVGKVTMRDGSACRTLDHFFKIDVFTTVSLIDSTNADVVPPVRANDFGEYVLGGVPNAKGLVIKATCEDALVEKKVGSVDGAMTVDLTLPNTRPVIDSATAAINSKGVRMVSTGAAVDALVEARDPDGDTIHYRWGVLDGNGSVVSADTTKVNWTLPSVPGTHLLYVVAFDKKGGYRFDRVPLMAGSNGVGFSGQVRDELTHAAIAGAAVTIVDSVDSKTAVADAQGFFYLAIKEDPDARYVMNIHKPGYAYLSQVFDNASYGGKYDLAPATQVSCDPNGTITLVDRPRGANKEQRGAKIILQPKSLVDKSGNPAPSPLTCSISTLDPSLRPLPGDYRAKDKLGKDQSLVSYGAVFGEFSDAAGNLYNLASGATAIVISPVPNGLQSVAPAVVPVWSYDETTGFWKEEGQANLQNSGGLSYAFKTSHFSYLNTDVAKTGQPTCIRLTLDPAGHLAAGLTLRVKIPTAPSYQQIQQFTLDNDQFHAIYRLPWANPPASPPNTVTLEPLDSLGQPIAAATQTINLDARPQMDLSNGLWPNYPYTECGTPIVLGIQIPNFAVNSGGTPLYLTGIGNSIPDPSVVDPVQMTNAYYKVIDPPDGAHPNGRRFTLGAWWGQNGFGATDGSGGTRSSYLNNNDLGFGRDMHCVQTGGNTACYVTNYGDSDQNPGNADLAATANTSLPPGSGGPIATVAMEYAPIEGQGSTKVVKFFVYQGGAAAGARQVAADLDHNGAKPVPQLCMVCHGGDYRPVDYLNPTVAEANFGASFREFDLQSFKYTHFRTDFTQLSGPELHDFHTLNNIVSGTNPSPAISEIIGKWYQGGGDSPDLSNLPSGSVSWVPNPQRQLYLNVVSQSCRTCHVAQPGGRTDIVFNTYDSFYNNKPLIQVRVCGTQKLMPNAKTTFDNFWNSTSPNRPATLAAFDDAPRWDPAFGTCQ
jgi:hypothetical protein